MTETLRFILAAVCLFLGVFCALTAILGVFRFRYALNRLHCAAVADSLAMLLILTGLMLAAGRLAYIPKLALLLVLLWLGSPVASRLTAAMELTTGEDARNHMDREDRT